MSKKNNPLFNKFYEGDTSSNPLFSTRIVRQSTPKDVKTRNINDLRVFFMP